MLCPEPAACSNACDLCSCAGLLLSAAARNKHYKLTVESLGPFICQGIHLQLAQVIPLLQAMFTHSCQACPVCKAEFAQFCFVAITGTCFAYMDQRSVPRALPERSKSCSGSHVLAVQAAIHHQKSDHRAEGQSSGCKVFQEKAEQKKIRQQDSDEQWSQAAAWSASQSPCQSQAADCEAPGNLLPLTTPSAVRRLRLPSAIAFVVANAMLQICSKGFWEWLDCWTQPINKSAYSVFKTHEGSQQMLTGKSVKSVH